MGCASLVLTTQLAPRAQQQYLIVDHVRGTHTLTMTSVQIVLKDIIQIKVLINKLTVYRVSCCLSMGHVHGACVWEFRY